MVNRKERCTCHHHTPFAVDHDQRQRHKQTKVNFDGAQLHLNLQNNGGAEQ